MPKPSATSSSQASADDAESSGSQTFELDLPLRALFELIKRVQELEAEEIEAML